MKIVNLSVAAIALAFSLNAFSQAKPADLSPTPLNHAPAGQVAPAATPAARADVKAKRVQLKAHKGIAQANKSGRKHAAIAKKKLHTASAKVQRNLDKNKSVSR